MANGRSMYKYLALATAVLTPLTPAILIGSITFTAVYTNLSNANWHPSITFLFALAAGLALAFALEGVGILAPHIALGGWRNQIWPLLALGAAIEGLYLIMGIHALTAIGGLSQGVIAAGRIAYNISPLAYFLLASMEYNEQVKAERAGVTAVEAEQDAVTLTHKLEQQAKDAEHKRVMEREAATAASELKAASDKAKQERANKKQAVGLGIIQVVSSNGVGDSQKHSQVSQSVRLVPHSTNGIQNKVYECACGKVYELSRAYNGHKRHCKVSKETKEKA